jgi:hypothetical protein
MLLERGGGEIALVTKSDKDWFSAKRRSPLDAGDPP